MKTIVVRRETAEDETAIRTLVERAFGRANEAALVDALRQRGALTLSLVAVDDQQVVGHILFTPVTVESSSGAFGALGLGPMGVLPEYQRSGIGSQLIRASLDECRQMGHEIVVVLGHPHYYPRFGFAPARPRGIEYTHPVPLEVFMLLELRPGALAGRTGRVQYQPEFGAV